MGWKTIKISILLKLISRFNVIPIEILSGFFPLEIDELILKFIWKYKECRRVKRVLKQKNKVGRHTT